MRKFFRHLWLLAAVLLASCNAPEKPRQAAAQAAGKTALIIVDLQYDFMPGGALATSGGDELPALINRLQDKFDLIVATQDWHPPGHGSFASVHPGHEPGDVIDLNGLQQILWPDHAVQGTHGAELVADLDQQRIAHIVQKGTDPGVDSDSGFYDNGHRVDTGLDAYLKSQGVTRVYVVGLALDYCVKYTALDAERAGYDTTLIADASRAVNLEPGDGADAIATMRAAGINVIDADSLLGPAQ